VTRSTTTRKGSIMFTRQRAATFAVMVAAAIVPALGAHAAEARPTPVPLELCDVKWVLPPHAQTQSMPSLDDFDVENGTASGERDPFGPDTVEWDDLTYDGC
jgi:hypothetical protein